jgi:hypothetical protein
VLIFPEHEEAVSSSDMLKRYVQAWWTGIRAFSLTASLIPVLFGALYAWWQGGALNVEVLVATLIGGLAIQAGCNLLNDYGDYKNGIDNAKPQLRPPVHRWQPGDPTGVDGAGRRPGLGAWTAWDCWPSRPLSAG